MEFSNHDQMLSPRLQVATAMPYVNYFDPDETPSYSASHPNQSCLTSSQNFDKKQLYGNKADESLHNYIFCVEYRVLEAGVCVTFCLTLVLA